MSVIKIHREVTIRGQKQAGQHLVQAIHDFCAQCDDYEYLAEESKHYERLVNSPACIIRSTHADPEPKMAFAAGKDERLRLMTILAELDVDTFNAFVSSFAMCFRSFCRTASLPITVSCGTSELGLEGIIPGERTRAYFQRYISMPPPTSHPKDIERLDAFICAVSVYSKSKLDLGCLKRYLMEVLRWSKEDAAWCADRIRTGLDVLGAKRRF